MYKYNKKLNISLYKIFFCVIIRGFKMINRTILKKLFVRFISIIILTVILIGCGNTKENSTGSTQNINAEEVMLLNEPDKNKIQYNLYIEKDDYKLAKYEPKKGVYLGAYILSNKQINYEIDYFEKLTDKKHALYVYNLKLGDEFPTDWVLSCIARMKTPSIFIKPQNDYNMYDKKLLEKTAKQFSLFDVPIFVHFYPSPSTNNYNAENYKEFYKEAYRVFKQYAPNVAFVFTIKNFEVVDYKNYYPGDNFVDWVGLNIYEKIESKENIYGDDIFSSIDFFYYTFQKTKPIMISQFAVSHYNNDTNTYYAKEAKDEINRVYNTILNSYPRIKAISYLDIDTMVLQSDNDIKDNFSITENNMILDEYKTIIKNESFLKILENNNETRNKELIKSPFNMYKIEDEYFISEKSIFYDIDVSEITKFDNKYRKIDGENYFNLKIIKDYTTRKVVVDDVTKKVFLYK